MIASKAALPEFDYEEPTYSQAGFDALVAFMRQESRNITQRLVNGEISADDWYQQFSNELYEGHLRAFSMGWIHSGSDDLESMEVRAALRAREMLDHESQFLLPFVDDLEGRYLTDDGYLTRRIMWRMGLYIKRIRGTFNEAFVDGTPDLMEIYWRLSATELHCEKMPGT